MLLPSISSRTAFVSVFEFDLGYSIHMLLNHLIGSIWLGSTASRTIQAKSDQYVLFKKEKGLTGQGHAETNLD
jgi:hypothetical protein